MSGMEMMLARMLGMKPEEMRAKATEMTMVFTEVATVLKNTEARLIDMQQRLERIENAQNESRSNDQFEPVLFDGSGGSGNNDQCGADTGTVQL